MTLNKLLVNSGLAIKIRLKEKNPYIIGDISSQYLGLLTFSSMAETLLMSS